MAGKLFMKGESVYPQNETMARIHGIRNITLGAIATCGVMVRDSYWDFCFCTPNTLPQARWGLSADDSLH
jgi:hypothetical protein